MGPMLAPRWRRSLSSAEGWERPRDPPRRRSPLGAAPSEGTERVDGKNQDEELSPGPATMPGLLLQPDPARLVVGGQPAPRAGCDLVRHGALPGGGDPDAMSRVWRDVRHFAGCHRSRPLGADHRADCRGGPG